MVLVKWIEISVADELKSGYLQRPDRVVLNMKICRKSYTNSDLGTLRGVTEHSPSGRTLPSAPLPTASRIPFLLKSFTRIPYTTSELGRGLAQTGFLRGLGQPNRVVVFA